LDALELSVFELAFAGFFEVGLLEISDFSFS